MKNLKSSSFILDKRDPKIQKLISEGWTRKGSELTKPREDGRIGLYLIVDFTGGEEIDPISTQLAHLNLLKK